MSGRPYESWQQLQSAPAGPPAVTTPKPTVGISQSYPANTDYRKLHFYADEAGSNIDLWAWFGDGTINTTGGGAGWVAVPRPQKKTITVWRGPQDGYQHEIPLIFDGWKGGDSIEAQLALLDQAAGIDMFGTVQPPQLVLDAGGALAHDVVQSPQLRWVIPEEPVVGEALRPDGQPDRFRQVVTVKFMVFTAADELSRTVVRQTNTRTTYIAKAGDTYTKIAAHQLKSYGGAKWGNRLAQFNGARDGASHPEVGQTVKIPTADQIKKWKQTPRR